MLIYFRAQFAGVAAQLFLLLQPKIDAVENVFL